LHVILYDDFVNDPLSVVQGIFKFIGVNADFEPDMSNRPNLSGRPRSRFLHNLVFIPNPLMSIFKRIVPKPLRIKIKMFIHQKNLQKLYFDPALRAELAGVYRPEILRLQDVLRRDLSVWLDDQPLPYEGKK